MGAARQRLKLAGIVAAIGLVSFMVASAYLVFRGWPRPLAGIVGGIAFPGLPIAWHIWGERRRRAKAVAAANVKAPQKKSNTSPGDRFIFRSVGAAVLVIGPMCFVGGFDVVRATFAHGLWFVAGGSSTGDDAPAADELAAKVPADAEVIVGYRAAPVAGQPGAGRGIVAWGNGQRMSVTDGPIAAVSGPIADAKLSVLPIFATLASAPMEPIASSAPPFVAASAGWKSHIGEGPSAALRAQLSRAPAAAKVWIAVAPRAVADVQRLRGAAVWLAETPTELVVDARLDFVDVAAAAKFTADARAAWDAHLGTSSDACRDAWKDLVAHATLVSDGTALVAHGAVPLAKEAALASCLH